MAAVNSLADAISLSSARNALSFFVLITAKIIARKTVGDLDGNSVPISCHRNKLGRFGKGGCDANLQELKKNEKTRFMVGQELVSRSS